jgi:anti-sigma B factor antagonist
LEIEELREGDVVIIAPHGRLDTQTEAAFERKLKGLLDEHAHFLVVDFGKADYVSGGALRALLLTTRRLRPRGGRLILCRLSGDVNQALTIAGFDRVFDIVASRAEAVERATQAPGAPPAEPTPVTPDDARVSRIAALALPLLARGHDGAPVGLGALAAAPPPLRAGLGDLVCRVLSETTS